MIHDTVIEKDPRASVSVSEDEKDADHGDILFVNLDQCKSFGLTHFKRSFKKVVKIVKTMPIADDGVPSIVLPITSQKILDAMDGKIKLKGDFAKAEYKFKPERICTTQIVKIGKVEHTRDAVLELVVIAISERIRTKDRAQKRAVWSVAKQMIIKKREQKEYGLSRLRKIIKSVKEQYANSNKC
jgi:hypothetical protein